MKLYRDLLLPHYELGDITNIELQKNFTLLDGFTNTDGEKVRPIVYRADFVCTFACGQTIVFDFKGMAEPLAKIKRKMFWARYPTIRIIWIAYSKIDGGYRTYEDIQARRAERKRKKKEAKIVDEAVAKAREQLECLVSENLRSKL